jgi:hypothetical protein
MCESLVQKSLFIHRLLLQRYCLVVVLRTPCTTTQSSPSSCTDLRIAGLGCGHVICGSQHGGSGSALAQVATRNRWPRPLCTLGLLYNHTGSVSSHRQPPHQTISVPLRPADMSTQQGQLSGICRLTNFAHNLAQLEQCPPILVSCCCILLC